MHQGKQLKVLGTWFFQAVLGSPQVKTSFLFDMNERVFLLPSYSCLYSFFLIIKIKGCNKVRLTESMWVLSLGAHNLTHVNKHCKDFSESGLFCVCDSGTDHLYMDTSTNIWALLPKLCHSIRFQSHFKIYEWTVNIWNIYINILNSVAYAG